MSRSRQRSTSGAIYPLLAVAIVVLLAVLLCQSLVTGSEFVSALQARTATPLPSPTWSPTPTATAKPPTPTASPTPHQPLASATPSASPAAEATPTHTLAPTQTLVPTATAVPLPTPDGVQRTLRVPILMYHYVSPPPADADPIRQDLSVPPERFEQHLRRLREEGYESISLYDLALALQIGEPLPAKPIVITLDDGYRDAYMEAFPLLRQYGYTATFFVVTEYLDEERPEYLTWDQLVEMDAAGMSMEPHGHSHMDLRGKDVDYVVWQALRSKESIEARIEKPVRFFCYPSGGYDELTIQVLQSAHYWGGVVISQGISHHSGHMFEMERVRVHGHYDADDLMAAIQWFVDSCDEDPECTMTP